MLGAFPRFFEFEKVTSQRGKESRIHVDSALVYIHLRVQCIHKKICDRRGTTMPLRPAVRALWIRSVAVLNALPRRHESQFSNFKCAAARVSKVQNAHIKMCMSVSVHVCSATTGGGRVPRLVKPPNFFGQSYSERLYYILLLLPHRRYKCIKLDGPTATTAIRRKTVPKSAMNTAATRCIIIYSRNKQNFRVKTLFNFAIYV